MPPGHDRPDDGADILAHDLRTSLTIARGFTQLLRRRVARTDHPERDWLLVGFAQIEAALGAAEARTRALLAGRSGEGGDGETAT